MRAILTAAATLAATATQAQPAPPAPAAPPAAAQQPVPLDRADIAIVLTARADRATFDGPPRASVTLYAEPGGRTEARYDRGLLPRVLSPNVTYSNIEVSYVGAALLAASAEAKRAPEAGATPR
jgi:hypothetical protein